MKRLCYHSCTKCKLKTWRSARLVYIRRLSIEEAITFEDEFLAKLNEHDSINVAGGKINGRDKITAGHFDNGWGWVFLTSAGFSRYDKIYIERICDITQRVA